MEDKTSQRRTVPTKQRKIRNARIIRQKEAKRKAKHKLVGRRKKAIKHTRTTGKSKTLSKKGQ